MVVKKHNSQNGDSFFEFEDLTMAPFDKRLFDMKLLTDSDIKSKVLKVAIEYLATNIDNTNTSSNIILPTDDLIPTKRNLDINKSHSYIAKAIEAETSETTTSDTSITTTETFTDDETIDLAANTNNLTLITGASDKNITYMQILQKPNDLELNLKYAKQQGQIGNYKQTIATLERLVMLYPDNVDLKLYLLLQLWLN